MTVSDGESKLDEMERDNLQKVISDTEAKLSSAPAGARSFFETFLSNARGRVAVLDKKIKEAQGAKEEHTREVTEIVYLSEKEAALSVAEKKEFSGFLKEAYFTKKDFDGLEKFYSHTWDRLSDGGRDEMSKRVWEGIRRDEYKFTDLPKVVQEKETERAYEVLKKREAGIGRLSRIPEVDRDDFIRAYEGGDRGAAARILERDSFRGSMFRGASSTTTKSVEATVGKDFAGGMVKTQSSIAVPRSAQPAPPKSGGSGDMDISDLSFGGAKLADAPASVSSADLPTAKVPAREPLLRGS